MEGWLNFKMENYINKGKHTWPAVVSVLCWVVHAFAPRVDRISLVNTALRGFQSLYGNDKTTVTPSQRLILF